MGWAPASRSGARPVQRARRDPVGDRFRGRSLTPPLLRPVYAFAGRFQPPGAAVDIIG